MKDALKLIGATGCFCLVAGLLLALTNEMTKAPIEAALRKELIQGLTRVLPACDNDLLADVRTFQEAGTTSKFYVGKSAGQPVGIAFEASSARGYGGSISILVGVLMDGSIYGVRVSNQKETPGLGTKINEPAFLNQFKKRRVDPPTWCAVKKDGGEIQAITGATISSRAVCEAARSGLDSYNRLAARLSAAPAGTPPTKEAP